MLQRTDAASPDAFLRGSYDREAASYDARRYHSAQGRLFSTLELRVLHDWMALPAGARVLDLPAGTGRLSFALAGTGARIVGVDISVNMLRMAAAKKGAGDAHVHFAQGSGVALPFADATFDAVTSFKFFHLVPNERKPAFIREMARVLKPGGTLVVEFNSPFYGIALAWFRYYFRKAQPGGMRMKCLFPDQVRPLFRGLRVTRRQGVQLPGAGLLSALIGERATAALSLWLGAVPGLRYLTYAIMIEARKPAAETL